jgi:hypothetical protein
MGASQQFNNFFRPHTEEGIYFTVDEINSARKTVVKNKDSARI